jgi:1-phosphofructokinase family hexose kinase
MILCITPNIALDRTMIVPGFGPGLVNRATETLVAAGGKGVNVARAARLLGHEIVCAGLIGGHAGKHVAELAEQEGLPTAWTWIEDESRTCIIIVTSEGSDATVVNEPGPTISAEAWTRLRGDVLQAATRAKAVCLCGSLPAGAPADAPADLIQAVEQAGHPMWVDTSKVTLQTALTARPTGLKVNAAEIGEVLGRQINDVETALAAAAEIRLQGIENVVLTLGKIGAVLVTAEGQWWARPPEVQVISSVGSGDAFLAGLVTALLDGANAPEALRQAVAVGTANTLQAGGALFRERDLEMVLAAMPPVVAS